MFILREKKEFTNIDLWVKRWAYLLFLTAYSMTEGQQRVLFAILSRADKLVIKDKKVYDAFKGANEL